MGFNTQPINQFLVRLNVRSIRFEFGMHLFHDNRRLLLMEYGSFRLRTERDGMQFHQCVECPLQAFSRVIENGGIILLRDVTHHLEIL